MMKRLEILGGLARRSIAATLLMSAAMSASASIITMGNIFETATGSTVDQWGFSTTGGAVAIDTLSWESDYYSTGRVVDVNGDGEIAFIDPYIYLFNDDGVLDSKDFIAANDDSGSTFNDGSVYRYDSFLSVSLAPGDYVLAIGAFHLSESEAIAGINDQQQYPTTCSRGIGEACGDFVETDHGDYQITWSDNVTITRDPGTAYMVNRVPEPSSLALLGLGFAGLGFCRRKRTA